MDQKSLSRFNENLPAYLRTISSGSKAIYIICICLVLGILISLPLVSLPVYVTGPGVIRPELERAEIVPPVSGVVEAVLATEGMSIQKSAPILRVRSREAAGSIKGDIEELHETMVFLQDLKKLLDRPMQVPDSRRFSQEFEAYTSKLNYLDILFMKADKECLRYQGLFEEKMISEKQYDDLCFEREKILREIDRFKSESLRIWQEAYNDYLNRKRYLENRIMQWQEHIHLTTVYSPVCGNLVDFKGVYPGSPVRAGEVIGIISPDSRLIGEFYLRPKDIAFVYVGQRVQLRMQSFPAREWGMPAGRIYQISDDFLIMDKQAVFRVKCRLDDTRLYLKNGYTAQLKKGMTFHAQCMVVRRSLLQLLGDKTDKWLNPFTHATN